MKLSYLFILSLLLISLSVAAQSLPFQNAGLPVDKRVDDLVGRMTLEEKISQMMNDAPPINRLGIPAYNRFKGEPCCGSDDLLIDVLRNQWGFERYVHPWRNHFRTFIKSLGS